MSCIINEEVFWLYVSVDNIRAMQEVDSKDLRGRKVTYTVDIEF